MSPNLDGVPLIGSSDRPATPWWALPLTAGGRTAATLQIPEHLVERLVHAEAVLGIAASDLVAYYVDRGLRDADDRRARTLDMLLDHSRITGWMPDGTPIEGEQ